MKTDFFAFLVIETSDLEKVSQSKPYSILIYSITLFLSTFKHSNLCDVLIKFQETVLLVSLRQTSI